MTPKQFFVIKSTESKAVEKYGYLQIIKTIEELAELQKALSKQYIYHMVPDLVDTKQFKSNVGNIIEELADVEIMIEQVKRLLAINNKDIELIKKDKIERLGEKVMSKSSCQK